MSIDTILRAYLDKRLFVLPPLITSDESVRTMIVSEEVLSAVDTEWPDNWDGHRLAQFRATLDAFTRHDKITVAEDPSKKPSNAFMARVIPIGMKVWDIRCIDPNPGIRTFGTFLGKNTFLALTWDYRENVDWALEPKRCMHEWRQIFGSLEPFEGKTLDEHLTNYEAV